MNVHVTEDDRLEYQDGRGALVIGKMARAVLALAVLVTVAWIAVYVVADALDLPIAGKVGVVTKAQAKPIAAEPGTVPPRLVKAANGFAFSLFQTMDEDAGEEDVVVSPASASFALAMAAEGATGTTAAEMKSVLRVRKMDPAGLRQAYADLLGNLREPRGKTELEIANALWLDKGIEFERAFIEADKQYFGAELRAMDLDSPGAPGQVNDWVDDATHGRITKLVDRLPGEARAVLLNAIYFRGRWEHEFSKSQTTDRPFTLAGGAQVKVSTMQRGAGGGGGGEPMDYLETKAFQAVRLPYEEDTASMYVLLPKKGASLRTVEKALVAADWQTQAKAFEPRSGHLLLPRFDVRTLGSLREHLEALGMKRPFTAAAEFSPMTKEEALMLSDVVQAAEVSTDEEGTVASAATIVAADTLGASSESASDKPFEMIVDRPFLFVITDRSGLVLFVGSVKDPR